MNNFYVVSPFSQSAEELLDLIVSMMASDEVGLVDRQYLLSATTGRS